MATGQEEISKYFILLNKHLDEIKKEYEAGTLWEFAAEEPSGNGVILESLDDNWRIECSMSSVERIAENVKEVLIGIPVKFASDRIRLFRDKQRIEDLCNLKVGDVILLSGKSELPHNLKCRLDYVGVLPGPKEKGRHFGVTLPPEHRGKGTTDGHFRGQRLFECPDDCGIFVNAKNIQKYNQGPDIKPHEQYAPLCIKDKVVWPSDQGLQRGMVRWIGTLRGDDQLIAGVEFDRPVGSGTGVHDGVRLFWARPNHAALLPVIGLVKEQDLESSIYENFPWFGPNDQPSVSYDNNNVRAGDQDTCVKKPL